MSRSTTYSTTVVSKTHVDIIAQLKAAAKEAGVSVSSQRIVDRALEMLLASKSRFIEECVADMVQQHANQDFKSYRELQRRLREKGMLPDEE